MKHNQKLKLEFALKEAIDNVLDENYHAIYHDIVKELLKKNISQEDVKADFFTQKIHIELSEKLNKIVMDDISKYASCYGSTIADRALEDYMNEKF